MDPDKEAFLYPRYSFQGETTLPNIVFDANLQEFSQRVAMICALETGGKISPQEAYQQIKQLWRQLKVAKENILGSEDIPQ